ncbi:2-succinyl-5-enolpyruvyl-6-hydroxy-3-cyclohexene-1-carboxylic-acid synthase [Pseudalkalibacillus sp. SCS-8]|uniref:2-succinyl-5-enolpyruvyl-6-hydroxy-3- cyclohexene-1-carboxylic-acid synthase n=1 Tax=Pseudalkalibacillus nanhaiensis TaxID=3115291 RepID=UPI0032DBB5D9
MTVDPLTAYVGAFVDELNNADIEDVVISPGSRSTPLAMMFAQHPQIKVWLSVDERSAAFFALGIAKSKEKPVALVCTSGTAAANYYPAIIEASISHIPLIILTADRPHELRDVGAPQSIDQIGMYGKYVKWFHEMALPEMEEGMLRYVRSNAGRACAIANHGKKGPVHLNLPFREPLVPEYRSSEAFQYGKLEQKAYRSFEAGSRNLTERQYGELANILKGVEKGLIVCGPGQYRHAVQAITELAEALDFPILADPLSPLRTGEHSKELVIDNYDALLKSEVINNEKPDVIIRFGAMPVSKAFYKYVQKHKDADYWIIEEGEEWRDPAHSSGRMIYADTQQFAEALGHAIESTDTPTEWTRHWRRANAIAGDEKHAFVTSDAFFEGKIFSRLEQLIPDGTTLFVGNSMPIRDLDSFFSTTQKEIQLSANRGANGIDGVISTALGVAATGQKTVLVIGDLSFYHDMNGLLASKMHELDLTVVLVNNNGGGIFSFLPQYEHPDHFEQLFGTPIDISFEQSTNLYDGHYHLVKSWNDFDYAFMESINGKGLHVLEIQTNRDENVRLHREYWDQVDSALRDRLGSPHAD